MRIHCREEDQEKVTAWFWPWLSGADEKLWMLASLDEMPGIDLTHDVNSRIAALNKEGVTQALKRLFTGDKWYIYGGKPDE